MQQQTQQPNAIERFHSSVNVMMLFAQSFAVPIEVLLHRKFGARYLSMKALIAVGLMIVFPVFLPHSDPRPLLWFIGVYLLMCLRARIETRWRERRGFVEHSRYSGFPRVCEHRPRWSEVTVKRIGEPFAAMLTGAIIAGLYNGPLGMFIVCGGFCMMVVATATVEADRARRLDLQDAVIDSEQLRLIRR